MKAGPAHDSDTQRGSVPDDDIEIVVVRLDESEEARTYRELFGRNPPPGWIKEGDEIWELDGGGRGRGNRAGPEPACLEVVLPVVEREPFALGRRKQLELRAQQEQASGSRSVPANGKGPKKYKGPQPSTWWRRSRQHPDRVLPEWHGPPREPRNLDIGRDASAQRVPPGFPFPVNEPQRKPLFDPDPRRKRDRVAADIVDCRTGKVVLRTRDGQAMLERLGFEAAQAGWRAFVRKFGRFGDWCWLEWQRGMIGDPAARKAWFTALPGDLKARMGIGHLADHPAFAVQCVAARMIETQWLASFPENERVWKERDEDGFEEDHFILPLACRDAIREVFPGNRIGYEVHARRIAPQLRRDSSKPWGWRLLTDLQTVHLMDPVASQPGSAREAALAHYLPVGGTRDTFKPFATLGEIADWVAPKPKLSTKRRGMHRLSSGSTMIELPHINLSSGLDCLLLNILYAKVLYIERNDPLELPTASHRVARLAFLRATIPSYDPATILPASSALTSRNLAPAPPEYL